MLAVLSLLFTVETTQTVMIQRHDTWSGRDVRGAAGRAGPAPPVARSGRSATKTPRGSDGMEDWGLGDCGATGKAQKELVRLVGTACVWANR